MNFRVDMSSLVFNRRYYTPAQYCQTRRDTTFERYQSLQHAPCCHGPRRNHLSFDISGTSFYFIACNKISRKEDLCITGAYILNRLEIQHDINTLLGSSSDVHPRTMLAIQHVIKIYIIDRPGTSETTFGNFWQPWISLSPKIHHFCHV
jgi:hypothetical protein